MSNKYTLEQANKNYEVLLNAGLEKHPQVKEAIYAVRAVETTIDDSSELPVRVHRMCVRLEEMKREIVKHDLTALIPVVAIIIGGTARQAQQQGWRTTTYLQSLCDYQKMWGYVTRKQADALFKMIPDNLRGDVELIKKFDLCEQVLSQPPFRVMNKFATETVSVPKIEQPREKVNAAAMVLDDMIKDVSGR